MWISSRVYFGKTVNVFFCHSHSFTYGRSVSQDFYFPPTASPLPSFFNFSLLRHDITGEGGEATSRARKHATSGTCTSASVSAWTWLMTHKEEKQAPTGTVSWMVAHLDGMAFSLPTCLCGCVCVCVFSPCRALGIRHYYLSQSVRGSVNIDREKR